MRSLACLRPQTQLEGRLVRALERSHQSLATSVITRRPQQHSLKDVRCGRSSTRTSPQPRTTTKLDGKLAAG